ncbi:MAG: polysaccharide deacetylase family protein [Clostridia bacterium]|nr:polysaccharide deacetylase family protein [Clostridia bacterium]
MYFTFTKKQLTPTALITVVGIVCCLIMSGSGLYSTFYAKANRQLPIYYVKTDQKKIAISFDCAWGVDYTQTLLDVMQEKGIKCTFFTVEFWSKKYPEYLKKISEYGHEIGTHSATHPHMSKLSKQSIINELTTSSKAISEVTGITPTLFRPPYGEYNDLVITTAKELGLYVIQWDVDSLDWKDLSSSQIKERVIKRVKNGSIVLFHNQGLHTAQALPSIIDELKEEGYTFVTIGELIYKDNFYMSADGGQVKNS